MVLRNIVKIDEKRCNGCGECVPACAEGAIEIVDGKAKLISEIYCDGLGACLGHCPQDAITIEQQESAEFDEAATNAHLSKAQGQETSENMVCPGLKAATIKRENGPAGGENIKVPSQLNQWPVQLKLVSPNAPYFANADLLLVADCVPFAMGDFHNKFLKGHNVAIGCPKLDDGQFYVEKLAAIFKANKLSSLKVVHMEVPCCFGLTEIAKKAIVQAKVDLAFDDVTISLDGSIKKTDTIGV